MRAIQNAGGHVGLTARNYPVESTTAIAAGQVVKLKDGMAEAADAAETSPILGIAAEDHPGTADVLNPRANGETLLVYDNPGLIFECPAPVFEAASGTATTIVPKPGQVAADAADGAFNGASVELIEKAAESKNTGAVGAVERITGYTAEGTVMTKASGSVPGDGDKYALYPPVGANLGGIAALDSNGVRLTLAQKGLTQLRCVGHDHDRRMLRLMAVEHCLGVEN